ncbi:MAG: hypothetical protein SynsKO_14910 [Synoicihabitans sp.]
MRNQSCLVLLGEPINFWQHVTQGLHGFSSIETEDGVNFGATMGPVDKGILQPQVS